MAQQPKPNQKPSASGLLPGIGPNELKPIKCICGKSIFFPAVTAKFASRFQTDNGLPTLIQLPAGLICASCGKINKFDTTDIPELQPSTPPSPTIGTIQ